MTASERHHVRPGWFTKHVFNQIVALLTREGDRYLVAARGVTHWVRNRISADHPVFRIQAAAP